MSKELYEKPEIKMIQLDEEAIIYASGGPGCVDVKPCETDCPNNCLHICGTYTCTDHTCNSYSGG